MAQLLIRHLDDDVKAKLQLRARRHGHTLEEEVRRILWNAVLDEGTAQEPLGSRIANRFADKGLTQDIRELRGEPAARYGSCGDPDCDWRALQFPSRPRCPAGR